MVDVIRGEGLAEGRKFPPVLQLGPDCFDTVKATCEGTVATMEEWRDVIRSTDIDC